MSKERARRRAEREAEAATLAAARAVEVERRQRRDARRQTLTRWLPRRRSRPTGVLAQRNRTRTTLVLISVTVLNVLVWVASGDWAARMLALALTVLITPLVLILMTS